MVDEDVVELDVEPEGMVELKLEEGVMEEAEGAGDDEAAREVVELAEATEDCAAEEVLETMSDAVEAAVEVAARDDGEDEMDEEVATALAEEVDAAADEGPELELEDPASLKVVSRFPPGKTRRAMSEASECGRVAEELTSAESVRLA